jgi:catechol 2,3-dioxygenase-like lactoylglutathione lyase family enzyme
VSPQIAVSDLARARDFYERKLGLAWIAGPNEGGGAYACGYGTLLCIYAAPTHAGKATATLARWDTPDLDQLVDELSANGVTFEQYAAPVQTDARGIHDTGYGRVAWFRDPDGNTFALEQV